MGEHAGREKPTEQESILRPVTRAKLRPGGEEASRNRDGEGAVGSSAPPGRSWRKGPVHGTPCSTAGAVTCSEAERRAATLPCDLGPGTWRVRSPDMDAAPSPERCSGPCLPEGSRTAGQAAVSPHAGQRGSGRAWPRTQPLRSPRGQSPGAGSAAAPRGGGSAPRPFPPGRGGERGSLTPSEPSGCQCPVGSPALKVTRQDREDARAREKRPRVAHARLGPIARPPPRRVTRGRAAVSTRWTRVSGAEGEGGRRLGRCPAPPSPARSLGPLTGGRMLL